MGQYTTRDGRRISIFCPITRQELKRIPDARTWEGRHRLIGNAAYLELQQLVVDAFASESDDYVLGFVSGFNGAMDRVHGMLADEESYETVWNNLILLISEAARYLPPDLAEDETAYLKLPDPGTENN